MHESNTFNYYLCNCINNNSQWTYEIENALDLRRMGCHWIPLLVFAIICIILGISVLTMPMNHNDDGTRTAGDFLIQCSGAIFAVTGLIDLITTLSVSGKIKNDRFTNELNI